MKRVIHVVDRLSLGGVTSFLKDLVLLQSQNYEVSILTIESSLNDNREVVQIIKDNNIPIFRCNLNKFNPFSIYSIYKYIKNYDIIHAHLFPSLYWVSLASLISFKKKFVFTEHSLFNNRRKPILKYIEKFIYNRYHFIIGVSETVSEDLKKWVNLPNKISFINNGVNLHTSDIKINYELKEKFKEKKLVIMAARIGYPKDHKTLIKAFRLLDNSYQLLIVGDGPDLQDIKELTNQLDINTKISFLGRRNDILSLMKTCDLSVLSTFSEGFGLGIIESLSVGTPCIGSDISIIRRIINNDKLLFQVENEKDLACKIETIFKDKNLYHKLVIEGDLTVKKYSIINTFEKYSQIYEYK